MRMIMISILESFSFSVNTDKKAVSNLLTAKGNNSS